MSKLIYAQALPAIHSDILGSFLTLGMKLWPISYLLFPGAFLADLVSLVSTKSYPLSLTTLSNQALTWVIHSSWSFYLCYHGPLLETLALNSESSQRNPAPLGEQMNPLST